MAKKDVRTVRISDSVWRLVQHEATLEGQSASQFIRDAALARAVWRMSRRGELDAEFEATQAIAAEVLARIRDDA